MFKADPWNHPDALDPAWLDRMYNNRALVPEHARHFADWAAWSERARAEAPEAILDIAYGPASGQRLDVFPSRGADGPAPVLVFLHGGYWRALDKSDHSFVAPPFTGRGVCVVVPNYTLCPAIGVDGIVLEAAQALAWTWRHISAQGGDPRRIVVAGHSAGGHLAAMLMTCHWGQLARDLPPDLLRTGLSVSGLFDLLPIRRTPFLQADLRLDSDTARRCSPARLPPPTAGRLLAVVGGDESPEFLRQNVLIREHWGAARVPVCEALAGLNHFSVLEALADPAHRLHAMALDALRG